MNNKCKKEKFKTASEAVKSQLKGSFGNKFKNPKQNFRVRVIKNKKIVELKFFLTLEEVFNYIDTIKDCEFNISTVPNDNQN